MVSMRTQTRPEQSGVSQFLTAVCRLLSYLVSIEVHYEALYLVFRRWPVGRYHL